MAVPRVVKISKKKASIAVLLTAVVHGELELLFSAIKLFVLLLTQSDDYPFRVTTWARLRIQCNKLVIFRKRHYLGNLHRRLDHSARVGSLI